MSDGIAIDELDAAEAEAAVPELAALLQACVLHGASVGFVLPFPPEDAAAFWTGLLPAFGSGARRLFVARADGALVGTVQLLVGMPPNGRYRAEIAKVLVHPAERRRGIGRALMGHAEAVARADGRRLLVLDTVPGQAGEKLYRSLGFAETGVVPDYALSTAGAPEPSMFMHKLLAAD